MLLERCDRSQSGGYLNVKWRRPIGLAYVGVRSYNHALFPRWIILSFSRKHHLENPMHHRQCTHHGSNLPQLVIRLGYTATAWVRTLWVPSSFSHYLHQRREYIRFCCFVCLLTILLSYSWTDFHEICLAQIYESTRFFRLIRVIQDEFFSLFQSERYRMSLDNKQDDYSKRCWWLLRWDWLPSSLTRIFSLEVPTSTLAPQLFQRI